MSKQALAREHVEIPGGRVETGTARTGGQDQGGIENEHDIDQMVVAYRNNAMVRLSDIGHAEDGLEESAPMRSWTTAQHRLDGAAAVGHQHVRVSNDVKAEVAKLQAELAPRGVRLEVVQDQATYIEESVSEVERDLLLGGFLAS